VYGIGATKSFFEFIYYESSAEVVPLGTKTKTGKQKWRNIIKEPINTNNIVVVVACMSYISTDFESKSYGMIFFSYH